MTTLLKTIYNDISVFIKERNNRVRKYIKKDRMVKNSYSVIYNYSIYFLLWTGLVDKNYNPVGYTYKLKTCNECDDSFIVENNNNNEIYLCEECDEKLNK